MPSPLLNAPPPDASATLRGMVNTGTQSFAGIKTFTNHLGVSATTQIRLNAGTADDFFLSAGNGIQAVSTTAIYTNTPVIAPWTTGATALGSDALRFSTLFTGGANSIVANGGVLRMRGAAEDPYLYSPSSSQAQLGFGSRYVQFDGVSGAVWTDADSVTLGLTSLRWGNVFSVLGNYSGKLTAVGGVLVEVGGMLLSGGGGALNFLAQDGAGQNTLTISPGVSISTPLPIVAGVSGATGAYLGTAALQFLNSATGTVRADSGGSSTLNLWGDFAATSPTGRAVVIGSNYDAAADAGFKLASFRGRIGSGSEYEAAAVYGSGAFSAAGSIGIPANSYYRVGGISGDAIMGGDGSTFVAVGTSAPRDLRLYAGGGAGQRVTIGQSDGMVTLESVLLRLARIATGSIPAAAAGNEGAIVYDDTTNTLKASNSSAWNEITQSGPAQTIVGGKAGAVTSLTSSAASIAIDLAANNNFSHTLTENTTLAAPSNPVAGQSGVITFTQHASAPKTLAYNTFWKFPAGAVPVLTATNSAIDVFTYYVISGSAAVCQLIKGVA